MLLSVNMYMKFACLLSSTIAVLSLTLSHRCISVPNPGRVMLIPVNKRFSKLECQVALIKNCQALSVQYHLDLLKLPLCLSFFNANSDSENKVNLIFFPLDPSSIMVVWFFRSLFQNLVFSNPQIKFSTEAGLWGASSLTGSGLRSVESHVLGMPVHGLLALEDREIFLVLQRPIDVDFNSH